MSIGRRGLRTGEQSGRYGPFRAPLALRGRIPFPIAALLALLLAGGLWMLAAPGEETARVPPAAPDAPPGPSVGDPSPPDPEFDGLQNAGRVEVDSLPYKDEPRTFDGLGRLSGNVEVLGGRSMPDKWKLVITPSKFGMGSEHAIHREREFDGIQPSFEEFDLPLGGYTVYAEADGLNSRPQEILLYGIDSSPIGGKTHAHLVLHLTPTGFLDGAVVTEDGSPVADLPVFLEDVNDRSVRTTTTLSSGNWRFDGLRDGRYKLSYKSVERPLIEALLMTYNAPQKRLDNHIVPKTATVVFQLRDPYDVPVIGAKVSGFGKAGGIVQATSEVTGEAIARFLPAGRYQINVTHSDGLDGKANFELEGTEERRVVEILMRPIDR